MWAYTNHLPPQALDDAPVLDAYMRRFREDGEAQALAAGVSLDGDPKVAQQKSVWVDEWAEYGGALVHPDLARTAGLDVDSLRPGPVIVTLTWRNAQE